MKIMIPKVVFSLILISFMTLYSQSFLQYRKSIQLENWIFHKGDVYLADRGNNITDGNGNSIYDVNWQKVTVPHTWNAKDVLTEGNNYYQGIGWYRSTFDIPDNDQNQRYFIRFEGVSLVADVFLNGKYLGNHKGGYSAFCFEITSNLRKGRSNVIAVKVDNSMQPDVAPSGIDLYPLF